MRRKFKMKQHLFCLWAAVFATVYFAELCAGLALSKEDSYNEDVFNDADGMFDILSESDRTQIRELREQVLNLQQAVTEITRSFSSLDLVAKNPSMMKKLGGFRPSDVENGIDKATKSRSRRDVSPTSFPSGQQPNTYLGPYSWPMFSGQCFLCPAGVPGPRGPPGSQGEAGRDGRDGRDSQISPQDIPPSTATDGEASSQQVVYVNGTVGGVIYTRWGNSGCPDSAELIYSGTAGGAHYQHTGGGSNYLCMPDEPIYDEYEATAHVDRALLYSSEFQTSTAGHDRITSKHDLTPTCAVCRAPPGRTTKLMIPARNACPSDKWRLEYGGYLMATKYTFNRSEFICMDRELEAQSGTTGNQNGALFHMVEGRCLVGGGLPCGPYVDGYELTCAVCTI